MILQFKLIRLVLQRQIVRSPNLHADVFYCRRLNVMLAHSPFQAKHPEGGVNPPWDFPGPRGVVFGPVPGFSIVCLGLGRRVSSCLAMPRCIWPNRGQFDQSDNSLRKGVDETLTVHPLRLSGGPRPRAIPLSLSIVVSDTYADR